MLSLQELHYGQNHSLSNFSSSDERSFHGNWDNVLFFFPNSRTEATVACKNSTEGVREWIILFMVHLSSYWCSLQFIKNYLQSFCNIMLGVKILHLSAHRKFEGSIGIADFSLLAIFSAIDSSNGDNCADSTVEVLQSKGTTLSAQRMVLA